MNVPEKTCHSFLDLELGWEMMKQLNSFSQERDYAKQIIEGLNKRSELRNVQYQILHVQGKMKDGLECLDVLRSIDFDY